MEILGRALPFAVLWAAVVCPGTGNAFLAGRGIIHSGGRPVGAKAGWRVVYPVAPMTTMVIMDSPFDEGGIAGDDGELPNMHSDPFPVEPSTSGHIYFSWWNGMGSVARLDDVHREMETDDTAAAFATAMEKVVLKAKMERQKERDNEREAERRKKQEDKDIVTNERLRQWEEKRKLRRRDRGGLPPNTKAEPDSLPPDGAPSTGTTDVNATADGFVFCTSDGTNTSAVVLSSISLEEGNNGVSATMVTSERSEDLQAMDVSLRTEKRVAFVAMRKIVNDKGDEGPMEKLGAAPVAKDGVKKSGDTSAGEASDMRTRQKRAGQARFKGWWGGVRGHRR